jgi:hypothetical protein
MLPINDWHCLQSKPLRVIPPPSGSRITLTHRAWSGTITPPLRPTVGIDVGESWRKDNMPYQTRNVYLELWFFWVSSGPSCLAGLSLRRYILTMLLIGSNSTCLDLWSPSRIGLPNRGKNLRLKQLADSFQRRWKPGVGDSQPVVMFFAIWFKYISLSVLPRYGSSN